MSVGHDKFLERYSVLQYDAVYTVQIFQYFLAWLALIGQPWTWRQSGLRKVGTYSDQYWRLRILQDCDHHYRDSNLAYLHSEPSQTQLVTKLQAIQGGVILAHIYVCLYVSCKKYGSSYLQSCQIASRCRLRLVAPACARLLHSKTATAVESAWKWSAPSRYTSPLSLTMTQNKKNKKKTYRHESPQLYRKLTANVTERDFLSFMSLVRSSIKIYDASIRYLLSRPSFF